MVINIPEKAMVFAAGFGKRMRPLTDVMPKPLIKVGGISMLDRCLDSLANVGVKEAVVNSHYLADVLHKHLESRKKPKILISHEEEILETGGGIVKALPSLGENPCYVLNSDIIFIDGKVPALRRLAEMWDVKKMDALMLLAEKDKAFGYDGSGDFDLADDGKIVKQEKPEHEYVYTGIMIINPKIFKDSEISVFSLYRDFLQKKYMGKDGLHDRVYGLVHDGKWLHIGTPESVKGAEGVLGK